jgi:cytochrome P450
VGTRGPYAEFARLRRDAPVAWFPGDGSGFWSVHRYADIVAASRDVATFSSARGASFEEPTDEDMAARHTIIGMDPPAHTKLRKIVSGQFSQRAIAVYQHFIEGLTEQVLDGCPASGELEFVDAVARQVPIRGAPCHMRPKGHRDAGPALPGGHLSIASATPYQFRRHIPGETGRQNGRKR